MGLSAGIVGLPNVGKSTIFNALSAGQAEASNYPFCTIEPNTAVVPVPDSTLEELDSMQPAEKKIPAVIEIVDIAGLVKGASKGEGLGNQFLGNIKDVDAILHVVRCFESADIVHVEGSIDAIRDIEIIDTELMLADLATVEKAIPRIEKATRSGNKEALAKLPIFQKAQAGLAEGVAIRDIIKDKGELAELQELFLMTQKPILYVTNVSEERDAGDNPQVQAVKALAEKQGAGVVSLCGSLESEIAQLETAEEKKEFLKDMGLAEAGLDRLVESTYQLLGLQTYYTTGPDENRAWTIKRGMRAPQAAGVIHTDFEKGFIKAEVYSFEDLKTFKTEAALKAAGKIRQEGKEYVLKARDILFFKFNN